MDAEDLLYILYTSGTTGKPKGIVHTTGGYLLGCYATTKYVFDLKDDDVYWCTADIGWVTGHSYVVYGPLANGATVVMYEGAPDWPDKDRFWEIIERYGVTIFYTAPTAIRAFMKWGTEYPAQHDLSRSALLGSVGEPINPEAWMWYHEHIGGERCPIVDTWWQTETGGIMITPLPGVTAPSPARRRCRSRHRPRSSQDTTATGRGRRRPAGASRSRGRRCCAASTATTSATSKQYWSRPGRRYFTGDGAKRDEDGYFWILGRVDDVLNVAGHRIGTMEVESALVDHPAVAEAAVVGRPHELKGQAIAAFVTLKGRRQGSTEALKDELTGPRGEEDRRHRRPDDILFTADLPKTRSGKIMRRLLRDIAEGRALGDTTTLGLDATGSWTTERPFAFALLVVIAACGRPEDAVPGARRRPRARPAPVSASATGAPAPPQDASPPVAEATCATAPLGVRVVAVRRESADIRVELDAGQSGAAPRMERRLAGRGIRAGGAGGAGGAVDAVGGRAPADSSRSAAAPVSGVGSARSRRSAPGRPETFWVFRKAVSLLLPGFPPWPGSVAPLRAGPEP